MDIEDVGEGVGSLGEYRCELVGGVLKHRGNRRKPCVFVIGVLSVFVRGQVDSELLGSSLVIAINCVSVKRAHHILHKIFNYKLCDYIKVYDKNTMYISAYRFNFLNLQRKKDKL